MASMTRRLISCALVSITVVSLPPLAGASRPPVDLTGTSWHTEGRIRISMRGRSSSTPTYLDVQFLPDRRFSASDPSGQILTGAYATEGPQATRLHGSCDPLAIEELESELDRLLEMALGTETEVVCVSNLFKGRTNRDATLLRVRANFRFQVDLPGLGRTLTLRERVRTRGTR
jgi:hypothetical protein